VSRKLPRRGGWVVSRDVLGVGKGRGAGSAGVEDRVPQRPPAWGRAVAGWAVIGRIRETACRAIGALQPAPPIEAL
jgi:hypothetical protein